MDKRSAESSDRELRSKRQKRGENINLVYPFEIQNQFPIAPPFINVGDGLDISNLTLSLKLGPGLFINSAGQIALQGEAQFKTNSPLFYNSGNLQLKYKAPGLNLTNEGELSVPGVKFPLVHTDDQISIALSRGLDVDGENGLAVKIDPVFKWLDGSYILQCGLPLSKQDDILQLRAGNGLALQNSQLECVLDAEPPIRRSINTFKIDLGAGLDVVDQALAVKTSPPLVVDAEGIQLPLVAPLEPDVTGLKLKFDETIFKLNGGALTMAMGKGLAESSEGITVAVRPPLAVDASGIFLSVSENFTVTADGKLDLKTSGGAIYSEASGADSTVRTPELQPVLNVLSVAAMFTTKTDVQVPVTYKEINGLVVYSVGTTAEPLNFKAGDLEGVAAEPETYRARLKLQTSVVYNNSVMLLTKSVGSDITFPPASAVVYAEIKWSDTTVRKPLIVSASTLVAVGGNGNVQVTLFLKLHGVGTVGRDTLAGTLSEVSILTVPHFIAIKL